MTSLAGALVAFVVAAVLLHAQSLTQIAEFAVPDANQGVAVDARFFYAIDNTAIAKSNKKTGAQVKRWAQEKGGRSSTSTARW